LLVRVGVECWLARNGSYSEKKLVAQKIRVKYLQFCGGDFNSPRF
jgi:hypothetical protein